MKTNSNETYNQFNPQLDLTFERIIDVPKELVWRAWTEPALLKPWFCPLPWKTIDAEIDLRPGGMFRNQRFRIRRCLPQGSQGPFITDVSQRHTDVAEQTFPLRAGERGSGESLFETGFVERPAVPRPVGRQ